MLFARAVEPGARLAENGVAAFIAFDLREKTMAMLRFTAHKVLLPALLLLCSALLINSAVDGWYASQQSEAMMARLQREKAVGVAQKVDSFAREIERQIGWVAYAQFANLPPEQQRFDYGRLLRQVPAILQLTLIDHDGREQLVVNRLTMDVVGSAVDRSAEPAVVAARKSNIYWSPLYFRKGSDLYATLAMRNSQRGSVTVAEVNLKLVWDVVNTMRLGERGYAYIVDGKGRLIAHRDLALVLRQPDLLAVPQIAAALATPAAGEPFEGRTFYPGKAAEPVLSVHIPVPALGWQVFVELPVAEVRAPFWSAVLRGTGLLVLGLILAGLTIVVAVRPVTFARPAAA